LSTPAVPLYGPYAVPTYNRIGSLCYLSGVINSINVTEAIGKLPKECSPSERLIFNSFAKADATVRFDVFANGNLSFAAGDKSSWLSFDSIKFIVPQVNTAKLTLSSGWTSKLNKIKNK